MEEKHERRSDRIIDQIKDDLKKIDEKLIKINGALLGTLDNPTEGFIYKTSARINEIETKTSEKINKLEDKVSVQWWLIALIFTLLITGSIKIFFA